MYNLRLLKLLNKILQISIYMEIDFSSAKIRSFSSKTFFSFYRFLILDVKYPNDRQ